jgi:hypothetical protein
VINGKKEIEHIENREIGIKERPKKDATEHSKSLYYEAIQTPRNHERSQG